MKGWIYLSLALALGGPVSHPMAAQTTELQLADSTRLQATRIKLSTQVMAFGRVSDVVSEAHTVNPDNRIAHLNGVDGGLYARPDLYLQKGRAEFWAKPRVHLDGTGALSRGGLEIMDKHYTLQLFLQEFRTRWQINENMYVQGGRYLKQIGTSVFVNPSNPFMVNTGRLNPKIELIPMDFVEAKFSTANSWGVSLIANLGHANTLQYTAPFFSFKRTYGVMVEHYGTSQNIGAVLSADESHRLHAGFYGQRNLNDAIVIWTDLALKYNTNRFYPIEGHSTTLLNYEMVNGSLNKQARFIGLAGISYTLTNGPTLQAEYYYNGNGYTPSEARRFSQMIATAGNYNFDVTRLLTDLNLGRAINPGMPYLRRQYVFTQIIQNDLFDKVNVAVRNLYSFDDKSDQISSLIEYDVRDNAEVYALYLLNLGQEHSDLARLIRCQGMIGLIYKF